MESPHLIEGRTEALGASPARKAGGREGSLYDAQITDQRDRVRISEMPGASLSVVERVCKMKANIPSPINTFRRSINALTAAELPRQCSLECAKTKLLRTRCATTYLEERRAPPCDALYSDGIVGHRSCDRIVFDPSAAAPSDQSPRVRRDEVTLAFRRQHDAVDVLRLAAEVVRRADMEALVRGAYLHHLAGQDGDPGAVDLDLVVVAHLAA